MHLYTSSFNDGCCMLAEYLHAHVGLLPVYMGRLTACWFGRFASKASPDHRL